VNIYLELTQAFNAGRLRAILSSGQAVVLHRLAIMSKDGDWILREDPEALAHVLRVLETYGAHYRFGAPLDARWLAGGWSAHFEFRRAALRVRTDFVTRPARLSAQQLQALWEQNAQAEIPVTDLASLVEIKKTNREKDYAVIGELARRLTNPREQLLYSRSAQDLLQLARQQPALVAELAGLRPLLAQLKSERAAVEVALDAERRALMHANERRLAGYFTAAEVWQQHWPTVERSLASLPLTAAHAQLLAHAEGRLPLQPAPEIP